MNLDQFLAWLLNSGGSAIVISWLFERWPWYQTLEAKMKEAAYFVAVSALSVGAFLVIKYVPAETIAMLAPYFQILYGIFSSVVLGTFLHKQTKQPKG